jgi:Protein of unknown function (DUF2946)
VQAPSQRLFFTARRQRHVAWLGAALLVLAALWPSLARAAAAGELPAWAQEICSVDGVRLAPGGESPPADLAHVLDHCPLCHLQRDLPALPPAPPLSALAPSLLPDAAPAEPGRAAIHRVPRWTPASPRAPPAAA